MRTAFIAALIPILLLGISFWKAGLHEQYSEASQLQQRAQAAQAKLDSLHAREVASNHDIREHAKLVAEFAELTGLSQDKEFAISKGEVAGQLSSFVDAIATELREDPYYWQDERYLILSSVTEGKRQNLDPFLSVDFDLNLKGRFFAIPDFLALLSEIAREQKCAISIGELSIMPSDSNNTGDLLITLPLRAYYREKQ